MRRLSRSARAVLAASLLLLLGAALFPRVGAVESDAVSAATATVTFTGGDRTVPVVVDAWVDPAEVPDGGSVNVAWALTLPSADELLVEERLVVTFPLPVEAGVVEADVAAFGGVDQTGWTVADGHLTVDLGLAGGADPVRVTVAAAVDLRAGVAPAVIPFGAPDALVLGGAAPGGGDLPCSPIAPVPALVEVVVSQVTVPTSAPTTSVPTTSPPSTSSTTRPPSTSTTTPHDPAADGDAPAATPPSDVPAVPPGPAPASRVVTGDVDGAQARLTTMQDRLAASDADLADLRRRSAAIERGLRRLEVERSQMADKLFRRARDLDALLAATYIAAVDAEVTPEVPDTGSVPLATALDHARRQYERLLGREAEVMAQLGDIATERAESRRPLDRARADHQDLQAALADGRRQLETFRLGGDLAVTGFHFPVDGPHDFSDTWHAPRSGGRLHEGTDIFAAEGTPLRAVERGVLADVGTGTLGGIKLWLVGESGTHYYYAHLSGYAPGVADGVLVDAGEVIGYVGHTGNARTTPPHLHFEVHPAGGDAADGYALLAAADGTRTSSTGPGATPSSPSATVPAAPATTTTTTSAVPSTPPTATIPPAPGGSDADDAAAVGGSAPVPWSAWGDGGRARAGARPVAVAVGSDGRAYVADAAGDRIVVLAPDGSRAGAFGGPGSAEGRFHEPRGLAVAPDGTVYVADTGNNRVQHFSGEGELLGAWGGTGSSEGRFNEPTGLAVDARGRVFVVDRLNNRVQVFDGEGRPLRSWGGFGADPGRFANPTGVAVGPDGDVYVADTFNARVQRFTARGAYVGEWSGRLRRPVGVVVTAGGELVVADDAARPVRQLDSAGRQTVAWGGATPGEGPQQVRGVALDGAGRLYVAADDVVLAYQGTGADDATSP